MNISQYFLAFSFLRFIPTPILARQDFPGQVAGWLGGWLRKAENKAKAQQSWGLGFAELGKTQAVLESQFIVMLRDRKYSTRI